MSLKQLVKQQDLQLLKKEEVMKLRKEFIAPSLTLHYSSVHPLKIVYGRGQYLYDENDQPYLDCINNVSHVGHCHPRVVKALSSQVSQLNCFSSPTHPLYQTYTNHLLSHFPPSFNHIFFTNSGSEANDLALEICRAVTGGSEILVLDGAYHGVTPPLMALSTYKLKQQAGGSTIRVRLDPHAWVCSLPDPYRGKHTGESAGEKYAKEVEDTISRICSEGKKVSCFMAESFPGCAGQVQLPPHYFSNVFKSVREAGGLCVVDEVQTGFGRGGEHFWVFESQGVCPDIVTIGKPMGNGHPISALVTSTEIATCYLDTVGSRYASQYCSDPVSLAVAEAVLTVIEEEELQENARKVGTHLLHSFRAMMDKYHSIGDVRGCGLFLGIELVKDRQSKEPDRMLCEEVVHRMLLQEKILVQTDGLDDNVIKLKPPITFSMSDADKLIQALDRSFTELTTDRTMSSPASSLQ